MPTITHITNYTGLYAYTYNASHNLQAGYVFFGRHCGYGSVAAAPTINGVAMTNLAAVGTYYFYYAKILSAGSYTIADNLSQGKQIFHVSEVNKMTGYWAAKATTLAVAGSGRGILLSSAFALGEYPSGYYINPPSGFTEVSDYRFGSGNEEDGGAGIEYSYKLNSTDTSLYVSSTPGVAPSNIAVELILEGGGVVFCEEEDV